MQKMNLENQAIDWSTDVASLVLSANTAESVEVPAGAKTVLMSGTADFYAQYGENPTATIPTDNTSPSDTISCLNPAGRKVVAGMVISVISAAACTVTFEFFG